MSWLQDFYRRDIRNCDSVIIVGDADMTKSVTIYATPDSTLTTLSPVGLYLDEDGVLNCKTLAVDGNTVRGQWGVPKDAGAHASGTPIQIVIQGEAQLPSSQGTAGEVVTAIANDGSITEASAGATTADIALATALTTGSGTIYIY